MKIWALLSCFVSFPLFAQSIDKGKALYEAKCVSCHAADGRGNKEFMAPALAGQHDWYIISSINSFKAGTERKNAEKLPTIKNLSDAEIKDLAAYLSQIP